MSTMTNSMNIIFLDSGMIITDDSRNLLPIDNWAYDQKEVSFNMLRGLYRPGGSQRQAEEIKHLFLPKELRYVRFSPICSAEFLTSPDAASGLPSETGTQADSRKRTCLPLEESLPS